jgi:hypothetical protein
MAKKKAGRKSAPKAKRSPGKRLVPRAMPESVAPDAADPDDGPILPLPGKKKTRLSSR